jgi:branched-chain amino acid transport system ATP-binding protein
VGAGFWGSFLGTNSRDYEEACRRTEHILRSLNLYPIRNELPLNLPFGQQRQLQIALALATEPDVLLLDEPAAGMTPSEANQLADLVGKLRDIGITPVVVEHNMNFIMNLVDRIIVLDHGRKIAEDTPDEIRKNPLVIKAYLGGRDGA